MQLEQRLRDDARRATSDIQPDVERHLHQVLRRGRRRTGVRRGAFALVAAAVTAAVAATGLSMLSPETDLPAVQAPDGAGEDRLVGRFATVLVPSEVTADLGMAGRWTLHLRGDGTADLDAPAGFEGSVDAVAYEVSGSRFRVNAFANDVCGNQAAGTYRWRLQGTTLTFTELADDCAPRRELLASQEWSSTRDVR